MNLTWKTIPGTIVCSLFFISFCFSQSNFDSWLTETEINGSKIQRLRVPEDKINSRFKSQILATQKQLDKCLAQYQAGQETDFRWIQFELDFVKQDPNWPYSYYLQELDAYTAYNVTWGKERMRTLLPQSINGRTAFVLQHRWKAFHLSTNPLCC